jgi:hypothetical protein
MQQSKWFPRFIKHWALESIVDLMQEKGRRIDDYSLDFKHGTNKVFAIHGTRGKALIIFKESDKPYDSEVSIRAELEKIIGKNHVPSYISHFEHKGKYYYAMQSEQGKTLTEAIKDRSIDFRAYHSFMNILANIHANMPVDKLKEYELKNRLEQKNLRAGLSAEFNEHCAPVVNLLTASPNLCYNSDSGTDNWIINSKTGDIVKIDTEDKGKVPYAFDLAHFLNAIPYLPFDERMKFVERYVDYVNTLCDAKNHPERMIKDKEQFMREYLNSAVYRAMAGGAYLLSKFRPEDEQKIFRVGVDTIDFMHGAGFIESGCKSHYSAIKDALNELGE